METMFYAARPVGLSLGSRKFYILRIFNSKLFNIKLLSFSSPNNLAIISIQTNCINIYISFKVWFYLTYRNLKYIWIGIKWISAMVHTGLGPIQVNNFLATLNLPPTDPSTLKRRELKIDTNLEKMARESCLEATKEEMKKGNGKVHLIRHTLSQL